MYVGKFVYTDYFVTIMAEKKEKKKVVALLSGGLDSTLAVKTMQKQKKGMAITVEPGIYIPKKFGVRIEDSLIVKDRATVMHKFTKDLITI